MPEHSPYQKKIIERYYDHRDQIMLNRLGEIVSEIYLAETDRRLNQLWKRAEKAMQALKVSPSLIERLMARREPELLAENLRDWLAIAKRTGRKPTSQ